MDSRKWQKTKLPGVQYRVDKSRPRVQSEEGGPARYDRYYRARLKVNGKMTIFSFGWTSEFKMLSEKFVYDRSRAYKANILAGTKPQSWKEELELSRKASEEMQQKKQAQSVTLEQVADSYIKDRRLKPLSIRDIRHHLENTFSEWKEKPVAQITRDRVLNKFKQLSEKSPSQANQAFRILRGLLNYAQATYRHEDRPIIIENPVKVLSDAKLWHNIQAKNRRIPMEKIGAVWNYLQAIREDPKQPFTMKTAADAVAFALLTGGRRAEVVELTWDRVNLEESTWYLPDPKNNNPVTLPLSRQARTIIKQRPEVNEFVFASVRAKIGYIYKPIYIMSKLSELCGCKLSMHDLRRTFTAMAAKCGIELWKTKLLMNHKINADVTISSYTETQDLRYLQPEAQQIATWIERQGKIAANKKVVDLEQVRAKSA